MRNLARWTVSMLAAVMLCGVVQPAEAVKLFGHRFRHQMVRTFHPLQKVKKVQEVKHIRDPFVGSSGSSHSRSRRHAYRRRTYRRHRVRRRVVRHR